MEARSHVHQALVRIQTEYVEMPQLKLTARQVQRLWSLSRRVGGCACRSFIRQGFLTLSADGAYVRPRVPRVTINRLELLFRAI